MYCRTRVRRTCVLSTSALSTNLQACRCDSAHAGVQRSSAHGCKRAGVLQRTCAEQRCRYLQLNTTCHLAGILQRTCAVHMCSAHALFTSAHTRRRAGVTYMCSAVLQVSAARHIGASVQVLCSAHVQRIFAAHVCSAPHTCSSHVPCEEIAVHTCTAARICAHALCLLAFKAAPLCALAACSDMRRVRYCSIPACCSSAQRA